MTNGSLLLHPADPGAPAPDVVTVVRVLAGLGLVGDPLGPPETFRAGPEFLRHVTFLGCAPHLVLEPPADGGDAFSHVVIAGPFAAPRLVVGANTAAVNLLAQRYQAQGIRNLTVKFYEDARHELLNETNRDEVQKYILDWLEKQLN